VLVGLGGEPPPRWAPISWLDVAEALEDDPDPLAQQFAEFILRDVLGLGAVPWTRRSRQTGCMRWGRRRCVGNSATVRRT
jgi:hypothetical protein